VAGDSETTASVEADNSTLLSLCRRRNGRNSPVSFSWLLFVCIKLWQAVCCVC